MKNYRKDIIENKKTLAILPNEKIFLKDAFEYLFGETIVLEPQANRIDCVLEYLKYHNYKTIVFVNFDLEYRRIIEKLKDNTNYYFVFTESIGNFSNIAIYNQFKWAYEFIIANKNSKIGIVDEGLFNSLKKKCNRVHYLKLDKEIQEEKCDIIPNSIGIINNQNTAKDSFYNELSAIKLLKTKKANLYDPNKITKKFLKLFSIDSIYQNNYEDLYRCNEVNLNINFTSDDTIQFLKSMDNGIPCILGNSDILDNNKFLKKYLIMDSDDDINEIAEKIKEVCKNKTKIMEEYKYFRKEYQKKANRLRNEFIGKIEDNSIKNNKYEKLLSVIVPVWNTEKYLRASLDSILNAKIDDMEIVIVNDGSPDKSEEIIREYKDKYPEIIRYVKKENGGLGSARNIGLKEAKGKYIASIDSDDTINKTFFTQAEKYLKENVDLVMCDWLSITKDSRFETAAIDYIFQYNNLYEGLLYTSIMPSTCNKIIKKSLYDDLKIKYIEDKFEDLSTNPFILLKAKTIKYINKPLYEYYIRGGSIMRSKPGHSMIDIIRIVNDRIEKYNDIINVNKETFKYYTFSWRIEEFVINQLYTIEESEIHDFIEYLYKNLYDIMINIFENELYIDKLNTLELCNKQYIEKRNEAITKKQLEEFILKSRKDKKTFELNASIMYYGNK